MLCASQGELQVFVEPFLPRVELVVVGTSPVARALVRLAGALEFDVWACDPEASMQTFPEANRLVDSLDALRPQLSRQHYVVVATINSYDEEALRVALESDASYVGVVASQRRFATLPTTLRDLGVTEDHLGKLKRPKGLPGTALRPSEIAFSVLAELVEARRQHVGLDFDAPPPERAEAIDPICGMTVDIATARHTAERDDTRYYFCCAGCRAQFVAQRPASAG
jgi:xanthine dehydrogenase accessory factor